MESWTDIANAAFDVMGEPEIADLDEDPGKMGRAARRRIKGEARFLLRQRRWPSAEFGETIATEISDFPGYDRVITLPVSSVRVNAVYPGAPAENTPSEIFRRPKLSWSRIGGGVDLGGRIAVRATGSVTIFHNKLPEQPASLGAELCAAIAHRLAYVLAKQQSESGAERDRLKQEMEDAYRAARAAALAEGDPHEIRPEPSNWIPAHRGGTI